MAAVTPHQKKPKPSQKHFYVCDEHFEQGCFLKEDCTILVNGVEKKIPRKIKRLKPNSIPSLFHVRIYDPHVEICVHSIIFLIILLLKYF